MSTTPATQGVDLPALENFLEQLAQLPTMPTAQELPEPAPTWLPYVHRALALVREARKPAVPVAYVPVDPVSGPIWSQVSTLPPIAQLAVMPLYDHVMDHRLGESLQTLLRTLFTLPKVLPRGRMPGSGEPESDQAFLLRNEEAARWFLERLAPVLLRLRSELSPRIRTRLGLSADTPSQETAGSATFAASPQPREGLECNTFDENGTDQLRFP